MVMNKVVEIAVGAGAGALASEFVSYLIKQINRVRTYNSEFEKLQVTMNELLPIIKQIESLEDNDEIKILKETMDEADELIKECESLDDFTRFLNRPSHSEEIDRINKKMISFCQLQVPTILLRNQIKSEAIHEANSKRIEVIIEMLSRMSVAQPVFREYYSVPEAKNVVGLDLPLKKLKEKLLDDSVDSLLVSAPGGVGKTTLATQLCHDKEIKGHFKHIFFITFSNNPDFRVIVQKLLQQNGYTRPKLEDDSLAAAGLRHLLKELTNDGPTLMVLDDVWPGAEALLDEFRKKLPGYKILVTSLFSLPSFGFTYPLETLKDEDARSLLIQCAPCPNNTSLQQYESYIQEILKHCNGFPILIEVVGGSLKGKPFYSWKGQVEIWSEGETILRDPRSVVLERLQRIFSVLEPHLKDCFMDMGSFLEDQETSASVLLDIWVELYGKGSSNVYMKYLSDLASHNLLKLFTQGGNEHGDGFYNELFVTQHDILRKLAIDQSEVEAIQERKRLNLVIRGNSYPDWCLNQREPTTINARFLSITTDDLFSSSWVEMDLFHFPNVEALVLNLSSSSYALPSFIATMKKLKVVIIINHGPVSAKLTNLSILGSLPDLRRIRMENVSITFLDILQLRLASLKKLSLVMCSLGKVNDSTEEIIDVSEEALPSLQEIDIDYCYDLRELPLWIFEAVSLVKLSITNCGKLSVLPEAIGNLSKLETLRLSSCVTLSTLPESMEKLSNLQFLDISYCLVLRKLPIEIGKLQKLKKISMNSCEQCNLPDSVRNLANLEVTCNKGTASLWKSLKPNMENLTILVVESLLPSRKWIKYWLDDRENVEASTLFFAHVVRQKFFSHNYGAGVFESKKT